MGGAIVDGLDVRAGWGCGVDRVGLGGGGVVGSRHCEGRGRGSQRDKL